MPRSPGTPPTPGVVVEEVASSPKPGLFARLFKKAPKVDDEAKTPSPEKPKKEEAASPRLRAPRAESRPVATIAKRTGRADHRHHHRFPESGETT